MDYFENNDNIDYKIILVHEPDYIDTITSKYDIDLVLAGHSHNGQINIPFVKNFILPYGSKKYYENYYNVDNTPLYISSGIGESRINLRFLNKPSINFYRIKIYTAYNNLSLFMKNYIFYILYQPIPYAIQPASFIYIGRLYLICIFYIIVADFPA